MQSCSTAARVTSDADGGTRRPQGPFELTCTPVYDSPMDAQRQDHKLELLRGVPLFAGLDPKALEAIGKIAEEREVDAGTALTHEGRHEGYFFVIVSGTVRIERRRRDGMPAPGHDLPALPAAPRYRARDSDRGHGGGWAASAPA